MPAHSARASACRPCAASSQVVFWDLRQELLEGLYRHNVGEARLQPILDILDATLGGLVEASVPVRVVPLTVDRALLMILHIHSRSH
jgi:hypothetical protein